MGTVPAFLAGVVAKTFGVRQVHTSARGAPIDLQGVTVIRGQNVALRDISLTIGPGELVAVIGPNGSGKSTLLAVISGLLGPTRGSVRVFGESPHARHHRIAHVMQTTIANQSIPLTVLETVRMGRYPLAGAFRPLAAADRTAVTDAMDRMHIADLANRQLSELSGGQRQRAYVAQGLAQDADILLLDEPITGLDLVTQERINTVVDQERAAGRTIVQTTHDVGTARHADRVVLLATSVVADGPPSSVLNPEHLANAYGGHVHVLDDGTVVLDDPHHHGAPEQHT